MNKIKEVIAIFFYQHHYGNSKRDIIYIVSFKEEHKTDIRFDCFLLLLKNSAL